jgi:hypothetical protein
MIFTITLGRKRIPCASLKACKAALIQYRDHSTHGRTMQGLGSSEFLRDDGKVTRKGKPCGGFSYNGRFWGEK